MSSSQSGFPCLAEILLSPIIDIPSSILIQTFAESLGSFEASIIKETLSIREEFLSALQKKLFTILSRYGCRACPSPSDLRSQLYNIAKYEFQTKPLAAFYGLGSGIPTKQKSFWASFTVQEFYSLYLSLSVSAATVHNILDEPVAENPCEERVFGYLQQ